MTLLPELKLHAALAVQRSRAGQKQMLEWECAPQPESIHQASCALTDNRMSSFQHKVIRADHWWPGYARDTVSRMDSGQLSHLTAPVRLLNEMGLAQIRRREARTGQLRFLPICVRKPPIMSIIIYPEEHFTPLA